MPAPEIPVLRGERVLLRPLEERDVIPLAAILAEPEVARWWGRWDAHRVRADLLEWEGDAALAIESDGQLAGFLQVGVMRRYERGPDGEWHDGLLMDLLAEEFGAL